MWVMEDRKNNKGHRVSKWQNLNPASLAPEPILNHYAMLLG